MTRFAVALFASAGIAMGQFYEPPQGQTIVTSPVLKKIGISQQMNAQVPLDVPFADETGAKVTLRDYSGKPVILALVYYQCPSLCNLVLNGVARAAKQIDLRSSDYHVVAISFDPRETFDMAREKLRTYQQSQDAPNTIANWHFLTGAETSSKTVADAMGFRYVYDSMTNQYAHSSAIVVLTPTGKVARYFYGIEYPARDLRFSLVEAAQQRIGTATDQVLLYCFHYDPSTGRYGVIVMNVIRVAGVITLALLGVFLFIMIRRDRWVSRGRVGTAS